MSLKLQHFTIGARQIKNDEGFIISASYSFKTTLAIGRYHKTFVIFLFDVICFTIRMSLFVFLMVGPKQNVGSLLTPVSDTVFMLFHMVSSDLLSMVAFLTIFLLVENLQLPIRIFKMGSYLLELPWGTKWSETGAKSDLAFCLRPFIEQTNRGALIQNFLAYSGA